MIARKPYVLRFDDEAEGGASFVLYCLMGLTVRFAKNGRGVAEGKIEETYEDRKGREFVVVRPVGGHDGSRFVLNIGDDFDEVIYL